MTKQRRQFDISLKLEVVRMIKEQGLTTTQVSQSMNIGETAIRRWIKQYDAEQSGQRGIGNLLTADLLRILSSVPAGLVCETLQMAVQQRCPVPGLLFHSTRGSQLERAWQSTCANKA